MTETARSDTYKYQTAFFIIILFYFLKKDEISFIIFDFMSLFVETKQIRTTKFFVCFRVLTKIS